MSQRYLEEAQKHIGVKEVAGKDSNPMIIKFDSYTTLKATDDSVPWCSAFANYVVSVCGDKGTNSAAARSWLDWGKVLSTPTLGCIVVIDRKDAANPNAAHVCFYAGDAKDSQHIRCIGGNQSDSVKISEFPRSKVIGFRAA